MGNIQEILPAKGMDHQQKALIVSFRVRPAGTFATTATDPRRVTDHMPVPGELGGYPEGGARKNPHMGISWGPKKLIWVYFGGDGGGFCDLTRT